MNRFIALFFLVLIIAAMSVEPKEDTPLQYTYLSQVYCPEVNKRIALVTNGIDTVAWGRKTGEPFTYNQSPCEYYE